MRIIVTIQHPAHVHLFRHVIRELQERGDDVYVFARQKDVNVELLDLYGIEYTLLAGTARSLPELAARQAIYEARLLNHARRIDPDVMLGMAEPGVSHVATALGCSGLIFTDTEHATLQNALSFPLADRICTPMCFEKELGKKQVRYQGYHELAYLHPSRFTPDPGVLELAGLQADESFVVLRLNAWRAAHDVGDQGFETIDEVVSQLTETGTEVLITSEPELPARLDEHSVDIPSDKIHSLLRYADLLIGESATMAAESAVLGTPAVFVSTSRRGYTNEMGDRYGLVFTFSGADRQEAGLSKAVDILNRTDSWAWEDRRETLLQEKRDTTDVIIEQIDAVGHR